MRPRSRSGSAAARCRLRSGGTFRGWRRLRFGIERGAQRGCERAGALQKTASWNVLVRHGFLPYGTLLLSYWGDYPRLPARRQGEGAGLAMQECIAILPPAGSIVWLIARASVCRPRALRVRPADDALPRHLAPAVHVGGCVARTEKATDPAENNNGKPNKARIATCLASKMGQLTPRCRAQFARR